MSYINVKTELITTHHLKDIFRNNNNSKVNWKESMNYINHRYNEPTNKVDTIMRTFKIKNLLKILPKYKTLYKRGIEDIVSAKCPRCQEEDEDWDHEWECNKNQFTENEVMERLTKKY